MGLRFLPEYDGLVQWPVMLAAVAGYLLSIVVLRQLMAGREKFTLGGFMKVYNATQVVLCAYMLWGFGKWSFSLANPFGLNQAFEAGTEWFMLVHYASKYLDFFDTWIMILKKNDRQLSFLHVYHHASILVVWGYLLQLGQASGTAYFGAAINSLIHLIMYSHFFYTSFGLVNPFKKVVTQIQIVQFYLCLLHAALVVAYETVLDARLAWIQLTYHVTMLILFQSFFKATYEAKPAAAKPASSSTPTNGAVNGTHAATNGTHAAAAAAGEGETAAAVRRSTCQGNAALDRAGPRLGRGSGRTWGER